VATCTEHTESKKKLITGLVKNCWKQFDWSVIKS